MKKLVIMLLIVLPFILIYFISITGRVLETYSHIYVESISAKDLNNNEIGVNEIIEVQRNETKKFQIVVNPELASNPDVVIKNTNLDICKYNFKNGILEVTGLKYGLAKIIITSVDRTRISYTLNIKVTDSIPTDLKFEYEEISIIPLKSTQLPAPIFEPVTAKPEYKGLIWESSDETIVKIEDNEMGLVKGLREGIVTITVKSTFDENLSASITVTVSFDKSDIDVHFIHNSTGAYQVSDAIIDLKTITDFSDEFKDKYSEDERFEQFVYKLGTNSKYVDSSKLNEGILIFDEKQNLILIKVGIYLNSDPDTLIDEITIAYKK